MTPRILMYSSYFPPEFSGAARQALLLARELRQLGHSVEFLTIRWTGLAAEERIDGFRVTRLVAGRGRKHRELKLWWNMLRFLLQRHGDFDVLHSHGAYYTNAVIGPFGRVLGLRSVIKASLAQDDLHQGPRRLVNWAHRLFLQRVDVCVAISRQLQQELLALGIRPERVQNLPNAVDDRHFRPVSDEERAALRVRFGLPVDRPVFVFAGVIDERKNINWLADVWCERDAFGSRGLLLVLGPQSRDDPSGLMTRRLQALQAKYPERVAWIGSCDDPRDHLQAADAFILPSLKEGLPNALLEAMACALPCVAAKSSGNEELVSDGETGFLYEASDPDSLASACLGALSPAGREAGVRARQRIECHYSIRALAERYALLYRDITG
ncbi:glycosyltransferase family 4 protein [Methyloversatilis sp.]|uniref:glycosyltransferase family 4 protein n=1 Tax=Methyloversatilis sp. TaxID=2569862 RepID=UPI0035ADEFD1